MNRLLSLILFVAFATCSRAATETKCHPGGEYCLNHWDCCSNTCLSFLYQCSNIPSTDLEEQRPPGIQRPRPQQSFSSPSLSSHPQLAFASPALSSPPRPLAFAPPELSPSYFEESPETTRPDIVSYESLLELIFKPLRFGPEITGGSEVNSIKQRLGDDEQRTTTEEETTTTEAPNNLDIKSRLNDEINPAETKSKEDVITTSTTRTTEMCKPIGSKCYTNDECCTMRCHGFLHQCVT